MTNLKLLLFIIFCLVYGLYYSINSYIIEDKISTELNSSIKDLKRHYEISSYHNKTIADSFYFKLMKNQEVISILKKSLTANEEEKKSLRKKLYSIVKNDFNSFKNAGLKLILFASPDSKAFLRVHKRGSFGDDLSEVRPSISLANKTQNIIRGFEQGKVSHAFRNIYPLFDRQGDFLGVVDMSFSSEYIQDTLDDVNKIHSHFLVNNNILDKREISLGGQKYYKASIEHENYSIAEIKDVYHEKKSISKWTIKNNKELINKKIKEGTEFAIYGKRDGDLIVISFIPIKSIIKQDETSAYIVSYTTNSQIISILKANSLINLLIFLILLAIFYFIYKQIVHKKELHEEVKVKTKELKELNESLEDKIQIETLKNRQKDKQLHENTKKAQMGEMLGNIAHQWRQPLSVISTIASGLRINIEFDLFNKENAIKDLEKLNRTAQHLSETIDIFRDYIKSSKELKVVSLQERVNYSLSLMESSLNEKHIKVITKFHEEDLRVELLLGELSQVVINILNNAKDALVERQIENKLIKIDVIKENDYGVISIEDNAGGIDESLLHKIFDPYFTTKHQSQGTGIGLYMSLQIIEKQLGGKLYAKNGKEGAIFYIKIPIFES